MRVRQERQERGGMVAITRTVLLNILTMVPQVAHILLARLAATAGLELTPAGLAVTPFTPVPAQAVVAGAGQVQTPVVIRGLVRPLRKTQVIPVGVMEEQALPMVGHPAELHPLQKPAEAEAAAEAHQILTGETHLTIELLATVVAAEALVASEVLAVLAVPDKAQILQYKMGWQ